MRIRMRGVVILAGIVMAQPALAQAPSCPVPANLPRPHAEQPGAREATRNVPITGYTLALFWGPESCHRPQTRAGDYGCATGFNRGRFTLHGLWPDGAGDNKWPQYCRPAPILNDAQLRAGLCDTPSVQLLQHEWAKHGTCVTGDAAAYIAEEGRLFRGLRQPAMAPLAHRRDATAGDVQKAFAAANPGMPAGAVRVRTNERGWLNEVWLCLGLDKRATGCAAAQGGGLAPDRPVRVAAP